MSKSHIRIRIWSILLTFAMLFSLLPANVLAADGETDNEIILDIAQKAVGDEVQTGEAAEQKQNGENVVIAGGRFEPAGSSGCFKTDNQNCGEIEKQDDRSEKEKVAKFKQSVGERLKMSEKTERGNHFNECLRSKSAEKGQNIFYPAQEKQ